MAKFGDGISWDDHVDQVIAAGKQGTEVYYTGDSEFVSEAIAHINTESLPKTALDCGCHIGRWSDIVTRYGLVYHGVDQSDKALTAARANRPNYTFHHSYLWDMKFKEEFDLAFCVAVLQHNVVDEQTKIVRKIFDALKPGGVFAFTESTLHEGTITQRTHQGWKDMAQVCGFRVVKTFHKNELGLEDHYICVKP
jgi:trans-aconitate methyltransferase